MTVSTSPDTWPVQAGVRLTFGETADEVWALADGTPVTNGTLQLTIYPEAGGTPLFGPYSGTHAGSPSGRWTLDVPALALVKGTRYQFMLVATPQSGEPETYVWFPLAGYLTPRFRIP